MPKVPGFLPSTSGFAFSNSFPLDSLVKTIPFGGQDIIIGDARMGLCGGMVFAACDYFEARSAPPTDMMAPTSGVLFDYFVERLIHSWDLPEGIAKYWKWMNLSNHDTVVRGHGLAWKTIVDEWPRIKADIDTGHPSPLGVMFVKSRNPLKISENHQVLAYGYDLQGSSLTLNVYDPNRPLQDDITITLDIGNPEHTTQMNLSSHGRIYGFFRADYHVSTPPNVAPGTAPPPVIQPTPVQSVAYRSVIRLFHIPTGLALHSHLLNYRHRGSSRQQQVTCYGGADDNDWWVVKGPDGQPEDFQQGQAVQNGAIVRLEHLLTGTNLHSHTGFPSPVTRQQETTCFGAGGLGDGNDNWRVEVENGGPWESGKRLRLIHEATNFALHSHHGFSHPRDTAGQQEVTAFDGRDDNDLWAAALRP